MFLSVFDQLCPVHMGRYIFIFSRRCRFVRLRSALPSAFIRLIHSPKTITHTYTQTFRDALKRWTEHTSANPAEAEVVKLLGQNPAIEKMDNSIGQLVNCRQLSLSTNNIAQITNLGSLSLSHSSRLKVVPLISFSCSQT